MAESYQPASDFSMRLGGVALIPQPLLQSSGGFGSLG